MSMDTDKAVREIRFPAKDEPLRRDVSTLGHLIGEMLVEQHGPELLQRVEAVRHAAIRRRESDQTGIEPLAALLEDLSIARVRQINRAFATYLRMANLAERVHRIRRRRAYLMDQADAQPGSLEAVMATLDDAGVDVDRVIAALQDLRIMPVFTAHPTEATRRTLLEKEYEVVKRLVERLNPERTPQEEAVALSRIRAAITSSWQTQQHPHARPTVGDELDNVMFYLVTVLYRVVPPFYESLASALNRLVPAGDTVGLLSRPLLRFGSWVGGDMDGNPNVDADSIRETLTLQRRAIIHCYLAELRELARYLSQSTSEVTVSDALAERLADYQQRLPAVAEAIPARHRNMPYRCLLNLMRARLEASVGEGGQAGDRAYADATALATDLQRISDSLASHRGDHAGRFGVERLLRRVQTFGFHLATLDVRQDALVHRRAVACLLGSSDWLERSAQDRARHLSGWLHGQTDAAATDTGAATGAKSDPDLRGSLAVFRAIGDGRRDFGEAALGLFIISMAQGADDVLSVLALAQAAGLEGCPPETEPDTRTPSAEQAPVIPLDVAPLLETVADLKAGPDILSRLLDNPVYRAHLRRRGDRQVIMVGYSDSNKDSGIAASRWALQEAQRRLLEVGKVHEVAIVFFHGRGGTVSRGGGNLVNGILGAPPGAINGFLRVTEQGEVINQKYGVRALALRNLELATGAALRHTLGHSAYQPDGQDQAMMDFIAGRSRRHYRQWVYEDPRFPRYFRQATPIDVIERLAIGSRPASRRSGDGIENLRAIPWVFAWAQSRVGFPGVFGAGRALTDAIDEFGVEALAGLTERWPFFHALINDVEMVLGKSDLHIGRCYARLAESSLDSVRIEIEAEFRRAEAAVLQIKDSPILLSDQRTLQRNIRLRNPYVDPMHLLQIDLLERWRAGERQDDALLEALLETVNGIALGLQNTG